jgi:hypothetical protein
LWRSVPGTKLISSPNPLEAFETWLYNERESKGNPHVVIDASHPVVLLSALATLSRAALTGLKLMAGEKGCSLVTFTMLREPSLNYIVRFQSAGSRCVHRASPHHTIHASCVVPHTPVVTRTSRRPQSLLEYARKAPEAPLATLTRLVDPLTHLKLHTLCDHVTDVSCTVDGPALLTGVAHAVDFAINERLAVIDVVGIQEMFRQACPPPAAPPPHLRLNDISSD